MEDDRAPPAGGRAPAVRSFQGACPGRAHPGDVVPLHGYVSAKTALHLAASHVFFDEEVVGRHNCSIQFPFHAFNGEIGKLADGAARTRRGPL